MIKVKNPKQLNIFDPWDFLTPKRRQMLDAGWPGLFREHILPSIPVNEVGKHFNALFHAGVSSGTPMILCVSHLMKIIT